MIDNKYSKRCR